MKNKPKQSKPPGFETLAIHAGASPDPTTGARNVPIYNSTAYVFDDVDHAASLFNLQTFGYLYSRIGNPTVSALEEKVAALENGRAAVGTLPSYWPCTYLWSLGLTLFLLQISMEDQLHNSPILLKSLDGNADLLMLKISIRIKI